MRVVSGCALLNFLRSHEVAFLARMIPSVNVLSWLSIRAYNEPQFVTFEKQASFLPAIAEASNEHVRAGISTNVLAVNDLHQDLVAGEQFHASVRSQPPKAWSALLRMWNVKCADVVSTSETVRSAMVSVEP